MAGHFVLVLFFPYSTYQTYFFRKIELLGMVSKCKKKQTNQKTKPKDNGKNVITKTKPKQDVALNDLQISFQLCDFAIKMC